MSDGQTEACEANPVKAIRKAIDWKLPVEFVDGNGFDDPLIDWNADVFQVLYSVADADGDRLCVGRNKEGGLEAAWFYGDLDDVDCYHDFRNTPQEIEYVRFLNLYRNGHIIVHLTQDDADEYASHGRVDCLRVSWRVRK